MESRPENVHEICSVYGFSFEKMSFFHRKHREFCWPLFNVRRIEISISFLLAWWNIAFTSSVMEIFSLRNLKSNQQSCSASLTWLVVETMAFILFNCIEDYQILSGSLWLKTGCIVGTNFDVRSIVPLYFLVYPFSKYVDIVSSYFEYNSLLLLRRLSMFKYFMCQCKVNPKTLFFVFS